MRIREVVTEQEAIREQLEALGLDPLPPALHPARAPPPARQVELGWGHPPPHDGPSENTGPSVDDLCRDLLPEDDFS